METLTLGGKTGWSESTSVVDNTCWFVALIAWESDTLVLNDVLLDDRVSNGGTDGLLHGFWVHVDVRYETIVPWNMLGNLRCSNSKLIILV